MTEITQQDVEVLSHDHSAEQKAILAKKIASQLSDHNLEKHSSEYDLVIAICQQLAKDVDTSVRQALAGSVKSSDHLPKEIAWQLARDVLDVSIPIIEFSSLLEDDDLIALSRMGQEERQLAITKRENISETVSEILIEETGENVVDSLLQNDGAQINECSYSRTLERFQNSPRIHSGLAHRQNLPQSVIIKMVDHISSEIKSSLLGKYDLSPVLLEKMVLESKQEAKRRLIADPLSVRDAQLLVDRLEQDQKLTDDLIIRALEIGDRPFFEHGLAKRSSIPVENARKLIKDQGDKGFLALYAKAGLPKTDYQSIRFMVDAEYNNSRNQPITKTQPNKNKPETWLTETEKSNKKWRFFK